MFHTVYVMIYTMINFFFTHMQFVLLYAHFHDPLVIAINIYGY